MGRISCENLFFSSKAAKTERTADYDTLNTARETHMGRILLIGYNKLPIHTPRPLCVELTEMHTCRCKKTLYRTITAKGFLIRI